MITGNTFHAVHSFGNWAPNPQDRMGMPWAGPVDGRWCTVKGRAPERKPFIGYYDPSQQSVVDELARQMARGKVDVVSSCAYFNGVEHVFEQTHMIDGLERSEVVGKPKFYLALELRGSYKPLTTLADLGHMCERMCEQFERKSYFYLDGKPVVSLIHLEWVAEKLLPTLGLTLAAFRKLIEDLCGTKLYFIANAETSPHWTNQAFLAGFQAFSCYNWTRWYLDRGGVTPKVGPTATDPADLMAIYADAWDWLVKKCPMDIILPTTAGFDDVNDNGTRIGLLSIPQFDAHLCASAAVAKSSDKVRGTIACALDEHFEGPTMVANAMFGRSRMATHARAYA
jgi:hypothetical protein